jgi:hypothetical protein
MVREHAIACPLPQDRDYCTETPLKGSDPVGFVT